jgi:thiol-disulfide isomerase/thioredoxin
MQIRPTRGLTRRQFLGAAGVGLPSFLAACSGPSSEGSASAPDFTITAYQGDDVLGGQTGKFSRVFDRGKPVILNFWAGLCPPCRAEMPGFQRVFDQVRDSVDLVGVDIGPFVGLGEHADAERLLADLGIHYPAAFAIDSTPVRLYQIRSMPTTVFLTRKGQITDTVNGLLVESRMRDRIQQLIATG